MPLSASSSGSSKVDYPPRSVCVACCRQTGRLLQASFQHIPHLTELTHAPDEDWGAPDLYFGRYTS